LRGEKELTMKRILIDNAYIAWSTMLRYRNILLDGRDTIQNKKNYISYFHNAVELFSKQAMIDNNDYRVLNIKNDEKDGRFARRFFQATDLNQFFNSLNKKELMKIHTCDYSKLNLNQIFTKSSIDDNNKINNAKDELGKLRNNETHFAIAEDFLSDNDFIELDEFMRKLYKLLQNQDLLPRHWGRKSHLNCEGNRLIPDNKDIGSDFTFRNALIKSKFTEYFKKEIACDSYIFWGSESSFEIANSIFESEAFSKKVTFEELLDYISAYRNHNLITIHYEADEESRTTEFTITFNE
jgi:hypothetical protein